MPAACIDASSYTAPLGRSLNATVLVQFWEEGSLASGGAHFRQVGWSVALLIVQFAGEFGAAPGRGGAG